MDIRDISVAARLLDFYENLGKAILNCFPLIWPLSIRQVCYDWSKGAENHNPATTKTYIFLHLPLVRTLTWKMEVSL